MKKILISLFFIIGIFSIVNVVYATGPVLTSLEPNQVYQRFGTSIGPCENITVYGTDFGSTDPGSSWQFYLNGNHINRGYIDSWTPNSFHLCVPYEMGSVNEFGKGGQAVIPGNYDLQIIYNLSNTTTETGSSNKLTFTVLPSCTQDKWECGDWNTCSTSGLQTRTCNKSFECPSVVTPSPTTSQSCTPPPSQQPIVSKAASFFDDSVLKAVVRIQVVDTVSQKTILQGTGINIGTEFLTNYHVVKLPLDNPTRYSVYACVTKVVGTDPDCILNLSITKNSLGKSIDNPKYDENEDLALLYLNAVYSNNTWKSWMDVSLNEWGVNTVNIAEYVKTYQDLAVGDQVYSVGYPDYGGGKTIQAEGVVEILWKDSQSGQILVLNSIDISHGNSGGPVFNSMGKLVGVTVACLKASINSEECKTYSGLFIPLPTLNKWYMNVTNSHISTFNGYSTYSTNSGVSDDVMNAAMCTYPLRQNAYYDKTKKGCSCNVGFSENSNGDCVDNTGYVDPKLRYGQKIDLSGEKNSSVILNQTISDQSTKKTLEVKNIQNEVKGDISTTGTVNLTSVNSDTKVVTSAEVTKPKSLWARFWSWFGF